MKRLAPALLLALALSLSAACQTGPQPFRVVWIADTHLGFKQSNDAFQAFLKDVASLPFKPDLLINAGDVTEIGDLKLYQTYLDGIKSLGIPAYAVMGNHDTRWVDVGKRQFPQIIGPRYFSVDIQGIHWMFLDSTLERQPYGHVDFRELSWISRNLKHVPADEPVLTFSHHPFRWRGTDVDDGLDVLNLYDGHDVPAFFNGHGHKIESVLFRDTPFVEDDALFHGDYVIMEKDGDTLNLFVKKIGDPVMKPWLSLNLHAAPFGGEIVSPRNGTAVAGTFPVSVALSQADQAAGGAAILRLVLDRDAQVPLTAQGNVLAGSASVSTPGWHTLDLYRSGETLPEDETLFFYPGDIFSRRIGEVYAGLATDGNQVYAGTLAGNLFALGPYGKIAWKRHLDGAIMAAPAAASGMVYAGTDGGTLHALRAADGTEVWSVSKASPFTSPPIVADGEVIVGSGDHNLYAFDAATGAEKWAAPLGNFIEAPAAAAGGKIFVGAWDKTFYALSGDTGGVLWKDAVGKSIYFSPAVAAPLLLGDQIYVAAKDYLLHDFDQNTGDEKWSEKVTGGISSPVFAGGAVIVPEVGGGLAAFDPETGRRLWIKKFHAAFFNASPVAYGDDLFLLGVEGELFRYDLKTGTTTESLRVSRGFNFSTPVIFGGRIWIGSLDGRIYAVPLNPAPVSPTPAAP